MVEFLVYALVLPCASNFGESNIFYGISAIFQTKFLLSSPVENQVAQLGFIFLIFPH